MTTEILSTPSDPLSGTTELCRLNPLQYTEDITLIWFDPRMGSCGEPKQALKCLREINESAALYTELLPCIRAIESTVNGRVFLITSGSRASDVLPHVNNSRQVDSIFIYSMKREKYLYLLDVYRKIVGVYTNLEPLCESIQEQIDLVEKQQELFNVLDRRKNSIKHLSKQSAEFLWFQLFNHVILRFPRSTEAKNQMIDECRHYYRGNMKQLNLIKQFERDYKPADAIKWYSKQSFIYKLVNKALRSEDIDLLYSFRFFISDLSESLAYEHKRILQSEEKIIKVYRGAKFTTEELNNLKANIGKLISTNGFLSTSRRRSVALVFAKKPTKRSDIISVLFEITCHVERLCDSIIFADIAKYSDYPGEKEVLFDLSAAFQIDQVELEDNLWTVKMTVSNEGQAITHDFIELTSNEIEGSSESIIFGKLLLEMGLYDKSQQYFEHLLANPHNEDIAWLHYNIGQALDLKGQNRDAKIYYDQAYNQMMQSTPPRIKDSAFVLVSLGNILDAELNHTEAFSLYEKALMIHRKYLPSKHPAIAASLNNIGNVLSSQGKYDEALKYYQQALEIYRTQYLCDHPDIATCFNNIGVLFKTKHNYDKALKYYKNALDIYQNYYPGNHPNIAITLSNIGIIYELMKDFELALDFQNQALHIYEKCLPVGNKNRQSVEQHISRLTSDIT